MTDVSQIRQPTGVYNPPGLHRPSDQYSDGSPISLIATATLVANSSDSPNNVALKNPTPHPIELTEIRFHAHTSSLAIEGGAIGFKLEIGGVGSISADFVQMWLFDKSRQLYQGETIQDSSSTVTNYMSEADYVWQLDTPLYIKAGETLAATFQHYGLISEDIVIDITYCGRVLVGHPTPRFRTIPFLAKWQGDSIDLTFITAAFPQTITAETDSTEVDLVNSQAQPVTVRRMVGRLLTLPTSTDNSQLSDQVQVLNDQIFDVNLRTSHGYELTRDFYPFRLVFSVEDRSYPGGFVLQPGDYVLAQVRASQNGITPFDSNPAGLWPTLITPVIPQISLIGERQVSL